MFMQANTILLMMGGLCMIQWRQNLNLIMEKQLHGMVKVEMHLKNQKKEVEEQKYGDLRVLHL